MEDSGEGYHEDIMRAFFRLQVKGFNFIAEPFFHADYYPQTRDLGSLLPYVMQLTKEALTSWESSERFQDPLPAANRIVLVSIVSTSGSCTLIRLLQAIIQSAWDYRAVNSGVYGIVLPFLRPWTSEPPITDILMELFDATAKFLDQSETEGSRQIASHETINQLAQLATVVFGCFQERLEWLER